VLSAVLLQDVGSVSRSASYAIDNTVESVVVLQKMDATFARSAKIQCR
jgi:hypothetical protein